MTTSPYDNTPNYSTTTGSVTFEADCTPYASVSHPTVSSTSTENEVKMKADSKLNRDEALEKIKENGDVEMGNETSEDEPDPSPLPLDLTATAVDLSATPMDLSARRPGSLAIQPNLSSGNATSLPADLPPAQVFFRPWEKAVVDRDLEESALECKANSNGKTTKIPSYRSLSFPKLMMERFRIFQDQMNPDRPKISFKLGNRVSRNFRQQQLDRLIDETIILYTDKEEAYNRAVEEETAAHKMLLWEIQLENSLDLFKYRQMERKYHDYIANCIWSIQLDIQGATLHKEMGRYLLTCAELDVLGFPRPAADGCGSAVVNPSLQYAWFSKHLRQQQRISLDGFVQTIPKPPPLDGIHGVFALDCDICLTSEGPEAVRVTVVRWDNFIAYQTLIRPGNPIKHLNTRFTGINEKDVLHVQTTISDVQEVLLKMFSSKTILIGHGLCNTLRVLRLIHDKVVDISHMFPQTTELANKKTLRKLCRVFLNRNIKHIRESSKYATACLDLAWKKIKDDYKDII